MDFTSTTSVTNLCKIKNNIPVKMIVAFGFTFVKGERFCSIDISLRYISILKRAVSRRLAVGSGQEKSAFANRSIDDKIALELRPLSLHFQVHFVANSSNLFATKRK